MMYSIFIALTALTQPFSANALGVNCKPTRFNDFREMVHKVAIIGEDGRLTFDEYARQKNLRTADVEKMFSGTGLIACDGRHSTAQLTGSQSVITTVAHFFYDSNCNPRNYKLCSLFLFTKNGYSEQRLDVHSLQDGGCQVGRLTNDWAVMRLLRPAPKNFKPYNLPLKDHQIESNASVIQVAGIAKNYEVNGQFPRNIAECETQGFDDGELVTNCDNGKGTSGSALLTQSNGGLTLHAIAVGERANGQYNVAVPVQGEFLDAIHAAKSGKKLVRSQ